MVSPYNRPMTPNQLRKRSVPMWPCTAQRLYCMLITNMYSWLVFQHCRTIRCYKAARHSLSTDWPWYLEYVLQWLSLLNYTKSSRQGRSKCCKNFENCCMLLSWWWPFKIKNKPYRTSTFSTLAFELGIDPCQVSADNTFKNTVQRDFLTPVFFH